MIRKYLTICALLIPLIFAVPHQAQAVNWFPLVPCGLNQQPKDSSGVEIPKTVHDYTQSCNQCLLIELGKNIIDMTFFAIVPAVGTLMFLIAGFIILFNARDGKPAGVAKGKAIMKDTAIGIAIILGSWLITNFILKSIATDEVSSTPWYQIECRTGSLEDITLGAISSAPGSGVTPTPVGTNTPLPTPGGGTGTQCSQSNLPLCKGDGSQGCGNASCGQYASMISRQAVGVATANVLKAFMEVESSCNISAKTSSSFGLMQLQPSTANIYASRCGVQAGSIDSAWLMNPSNAEKSICIAAQYIDAISKGQCGTNIRNVYAGYNGGEAGASAACAPSSNCSNEKSCSSEAMKRWECLYDDNAHTVCNTGYNETRTGSTRLQYCVTNPGF